MVSYGSADMPVTLDPFTDIIEVGWPSPYVTARIEIDRDDAFAQEGACSPQDPGTGVGFWWDAWLTSAGYKFRTPSTPISFIAVHSKTGTSPADAPVPSGAPSLPAAQPFGDWVQASVSAAVWDPPVGALISLPGYESLDGLFYDTLTAPLHRIGQPFIGSMSLCGAFGFPAREVAAQPQTNTHANGATEFAATSFSVAGLSILHRGRTYNARGIRPVSDTEFEDGVFYQVVDYLDVLFERAA